MSLLKSTVKLVSKLFIISTLPLIGYSVFADTPQKDTELMVATKCFIENYNGFASLDNLQYKQLSEDPAQDLVLFEVAMQPWVSQLDKLNVTKLPPDCGRFVNVESEWQEYLLKNQITKSEISYNDFFSDYITDEVKISPIKKEQNKSESSNELINELMLKVDEEKITENLKTMTDFYNRSATTEDGIKAAAWIKESLEALREQNNKTAEEFSVEYIYNNSSFYRQPSVVAVLGKNLPGKALVVSSHLDTVSGRMPGADDDGSGSVVVLETARVILEKNYNYTRPVYFMWYSAEEVGLIGSKNVVKHVITNNIAIDSVLHFDTIGRRADNSDPTLWFLRDNVDTMFTDYLADLVRTHVNVPVNFTRCGYACSDHASWTRKGFSSAAGFESAMEDINPDLHTAQDTMEKVSIENLANFTKLAVSYIGDRAS